ncbi:glycosyltransferase family 39 protein [Litorilinea aerophila]|uniref:Glycosyltransferase family 39 protein n=1 Tax=Litorilinea aerophila TaxID=1204385 RepID=A0A540VFH3_9CHLR|nr:glycosyltransferase family 39 protein [Litorilinea aerophila]MCC9076801.1 glycosyltransferase family 39 protein [Litorilinea aerophila]
MQAGKRQAVATRTAEAAGRLSILGRQISVGRLLAMIALVAVLLRVASALYQGDTVNVLPGVFDEVSYDGLARRVLGGHGFTFAQDHWPATKAGEPTAHWSFLYTLYIAGVYALFGAHPLAARLIQAVLTGLLQSWLAWRIGRRVFGQAAGLIAAALSAGYIYFFYYAGALVTESFYMVAILWALDAALRLGDRLAAGSDAPRPGANAWLWLELGAAVAVAGLLRQVFLLFVPFLYLWLAWRGLAGSGGWRRRAWAAAPGLLVGFVLATAVVVAAIAPWTIRNARAFGTFVPLNTNAGYAFYWGNHPVYGTRFQGILPADGPSYVDLLPRELASLNEAELDQALLRRGIGFVLADPWRYGLLSLSRAREYFKFWPSAESSTISNLSRVASFGLLLPFMLVGLALAVGRLIRRDDPRQGPAVLLLGLFIGVYTGVHLLTWTLIRYRLPVDSVLLLFAALTLVELAARRGWLTNAATAGPVSPSAVSTSSVSSSVSTFDSYL